MRTLRQAVALLVLLILGASVALAAGPAKVTKDEASTALDQVIDRVVQREHDMEEAMRRYHPIVETYFQILHSDAELGTVPDGDRYFIGRLDLTERTKETHYVSAGPTGWRKVLSPLRHLYTIDIMPLGFSSMIFIDRNGFDRNSYNFQFVRREFLGEVRCIVFQVTPKEKSGKGRFLGRIWVEDKEYNIVRFNGAFTHPPAGGIYFHMDSWRKNVQPGLWLPSEVYSEEHNIHYSLADRRMTFKAHTRLWAYDPKHGGRQEEFTDMVIDSPNAKDQSEAAQDWSPVMSLRAWQREAEDNVLDRLERAGVLAAPGEVDKVLETVINNLIITNNLNIQPDVHCRVLLTSPLESFTVGHTIIVSRGLLDVLPDEASLAMVLSHELAHISTGDLVDTSFGFTDRMLFADEKTYDRLKFAREEPQELTADKQAIEFLKNSPYKDKLASAGLFLRQLQARAATLPSLNAPRLGNGLTAGGQVVRMRELMDGSPELHVRDLSQVAALPLGGRIKLNPWDNRVEMMKTKALPLQSIREKMPFEVAPVIPHLMRLNNSVDLAVNAGK